MRDTRIAGAADSCIIDQGARSQYLRMQVSGCGFGGYTYGTHGMYLKGPGQSVVDSEVSNSLDSCISVRFQDAVVSGNRVHGCLEGISWYEYATANGTVAPDAQPHLGHRHGHLPGRLDDAELPARQQHDPGRARDRRREHGHLGAHVARASRSRTRS